MDVPLRSILDLSESPCHALAKWLVKILTPIKNRLATHCISDTFDFARRIENINASDVRMFSFDIVSLFTNLPLIETIDYICEFVTSGEVEIGLNH